MCLSPPGDGNLFSSPVKVSISWSSTRDSHRSIDLERKILATRGELIFNSRIELYTSFGLEDFFFIFSSRVNRGFFLFFFHDVRRTLAFVALHCKFWERGFEAD